MKMREIIDLIKSNKFICEAEFNGSTSMLAAYKSASSDELEKEAELWAGACEDEKAEDFDWYFDPSYPIANIGDAPKDWRKWIEIEISDSTEYGFDGRYDSLTDGSPIEEPIVLHIGDDGKGRIWDGWHRTGVSVMLGRTTIPAIVGIRKPS